MKVASEAVELGREGREVSLGIGVFDGVHLGHREIISRAIREARNRNGLAVVVTFDRHPESVIAPDRAPKLISPTEQKLAIIRDLGVDAVLMLHFDEHLRSVSGEDFVRKLGRDLETLRHVYVGRDFVFGYRRSGNVDLLRRLGSELGFAVDPVSPVVYGGAPVSSTRIREAIRTGELQLAGQLLGRPYSLSGTVAQGDGLGRKLGFPTANVDVSGLVLPPLGVYAGTTEVNGHRYQVVANLGSRPTVAGEQAPIRFEPHLIDFAGDLYGRSLAVVLGPRLREERRFDSLAELKAQIGKDLNEARNRQV